MLATSANPGAIPGTSTLVVTGASFGSVIEGGGSGNAPSVVVNLTYAPSIISQISSVRVVLRSPSGELVSERAEVNDNESIETFEVGLSRQSISGEYSLHEVQVQFAGDPAVTGLPSEGLTIEANELSSLIGSRFIELENPDQDITPPTITDILLPVRSILVDNDLPAGLGGGDSAEITFQATINDDNSGLNVIEFEFDIGPGSPAVIGAEVGIFGDLDEGEQQLSAFNSESPAGRYVFEFIRVSDDQGNTTFLTADDLAGLGYQNAIQVVTPEDLQDATSPNVSALSLSSDTVTIDADGGTLDVSLTATDTGFGATGVQSVTIVLTSSLGSRYELFAEVAAGEGDNGTATFELPRDFPAGTFTIERLSVNDAAFNRQDVTPETTILTIVNPEGGDVANNRLRGDETDNIIVGRTGDDTIIGGDGADELLLGAGDDVSFAGSGDEGNDTIMGGDGNDLIGAGAGDDYIVGGSLVTAGVQTIVFTSLEERRDGADTVFGGEGSDTIYGGNPSFAEDDEGNTIFADFGSVAPDQLYAGTGDDFVQASFGSDVIGGGAGSDTLRGGAGHDVIFGGRGDVGATGVNDVIFGENGNDAVFASGGDDSVKGGADNDTLFGGSGNDTLSGDGGADQIFGGSGNDLLSGGSGSDTFFFAPGSGVDVVTDFDITEDRLFLSAYSDRFETLADLQASSGVTEIDGEIGLMINFGEGDQVFIAGVISFNQLPITF